MKGAVGAALGITLSIIIACGDAQRPIDWDKHLQKENEITALWTQIRGFRHDAHMDLEPTRSDVFQWDKHTVQEAARVCPADHQIPATCNDVCDLSVAICDNAEAICSIANELGKQDEYAQQKCASAKASCREAKQRCCNCSQGPAKTPVIL